jgi:acetylornithine deacetylase/succinyl-diaminopimelate desuccinylase-like protein
MKSGTASLVIAFAALYEQREELRGSVVLCAVSDEETGGRWGTQYLIKQDRERWGGDVMLSSEPSGMTIRFSEKGTLRISGVVRTKGAHGAYLNLRFAFPQEGFNAPPEMAIHLKDPETLAAVDRAMGPGTSTIIAKPTVNIGTIKGGTKVNMIPDTCEFELDIRLPVGLTAEEVLSVLDSIGQRYADEGASITPKKQEAASNPSSFSPLDHAMVECLKNAATRAGGPQPVATPSMGATDCKHYRYAGIPAYVYGCRPSTMASVHESASVEEFYHVTRTHALAGWEFLSG